MVVHVREPYAIHTYICRYKCGECAYDTTAHWYQHQHHYEEHREQEKA